MHTLPKVLTTKDLLLIGSDYRMSEGTVTKPGMKAVPQLKETTQHQWLQGPFHGLFSIQKLKGNKNLVYYS